MTSDPELAQERAAARAERSRETEARREQVWAENAAALQLELANTARLKGLRLAKEAAEREAAEIASATAKAAAAARKKTAAKSAKPAKRTPNRKT